MEAINGLEERKDVVKDGRESEVEGDTNNDCLTQLTAGAHGVKNKI